MDGEERYPGSHRKLIKGDRTVVFAFGDGEELGPRMLARIGRQTGLKPSDL